VGHRNKLGPYSSDKHNDIKLTSQIPNAVIWQRKKLNWSDYINLLLFEKLTHRRLWEFSNKMFDKKKHLVVYFELSTYILLFTKEPLTFPHRENTDSVELVNVLTNVNELFGTKKRLSWAIKE